MAPALKFDRAVIMHAVIKPYVIGYDRGGWLHEYTERFVTLAATGNDVEIRGSCESACTLVMAHIPKKRLCFSDQAFLRFHKANTADGKPSMIHTQWMVNSYPIEVRSWIDGMGGAEKMPADSYWTLPASIMWALGYRRCSS